MAVFSLKFLEPLVATAFELLWKDDFALNKKLLDRNKSIYELFDVDKV